MALMPCTNERGVDMSFTETELENMADHLRSAGFQLPDDWDNDRLALLASAILESLDMEKAE